MNLKNRSRLLKYIRPKITRKKLSISFFRTDRTYQDSMSFLFGDIVHAQSGDPGSSNSVDDASGEVNSGSDNCIACD